MSEHNNTTDGFTAKSRTRPALRWLGAAAVALALGATSVAGAGAFGVMPGHARHGQVDPATAAKHIDNMVDTIAAESTPRQKARLVEIAKAAFTDLHSMHGQMDAGHKRVHELLMQPVVDRGALELVRVEQIGRMDAMSKRLLAAVADASDILTPEQRLRFHELMKKHMH